MIADDVYDQAVEICKNEINQLREEIKYLNDEKDNLIGNHQILKQELNYQEDMYANLQEKYDALKQKDMNDEPA
jgi:predicted  nucleic acid-binding Zn-ribbon protein